MGFCKWLYSGLGVFCVGWGLDRGEFLRLLREDEEFRYAVVGLLGIEDIRRSQARLEEAVAKLDAAVAELTRGVNMLFEEQRRLAEEQKRLAEEQKRLAEEQRRLAEGQRRLERGLRSVARFIDSVSTTLEEEAHYIVAARLRERGLEVVLDRLVRPYVEFDIYGAGDDFVVIGDVKTRLSPRHLRVLERKLGVLLGREPELLRGRVLRVVYALWAHPEAVELARELGVWVVTPSREVSEARL